MSTFEEVPQFEIIEALGRTLKGISSIALTYDVIVNQCEMWVVNCQSIDRYTLGAADKNVDIMNLAMPSCFKQYLTYYCH